jgi:hypothetical protein
MVRFLEREGYDIKYFDNTDLNHSNYLLQPPVAKVMISMGHDEYWSREMVRNCQVAQANGMSFVFAGANDAYWECRWEDDKQNKPYRILTCYKDWVQHDTWYGGATGRPLPTGWPTGTDTARQSTFRQVAAVANAGSPDWSLFEGNFQGVAYIGDPFQGPQIVNPAALSHWAFTGTGFTAGPPDNQMPHTLGYEVDAYVTGEAWTPANVTVLFNSPVSGLARDHHFPGALSMNSSQVTIYQHNPPSGPYVFSTGSMHFNWCLDDFGAHWGPDMRPPADPRHDMGKKLFKNVLNRMIE